MYFSFVAVCMKKYIKEYIFLRYYICSYSPDNSVYFATLLLLQLVASIEIYSRTNFTVLGIFHTIVVRMIPITPIFQFIQYLLETIYNCSQQNNSRGCHLYIPKLRQFFGRFEIIIYPFIFFQIYSIPLEHRYPQSDISSSFG